MRKKELENKLKVLENKLDCYIDLYKLEKKLIAEQYKNFAELLRDIKNKSEDYIIDIIEVLDIYSEEKYKEIEKLDKDKIN